MNPASTSRSNALSTVGLIEEFEPALAARRIGAQDVRLGGAHPNLLQGRSQVIPGRRDIDRPTKAAHAAYGTPSWCGGGSGRRTVELTAGQNTLTSLDGN